MFNCYDTILQQQQQRSLESNKVWQGDASCEECVKSPGLKKKKKKEEFMGGCGVQFLCHTERPHTGWTQEEPRLCRGQSSPTFPAKSHNRFQGTTVLFFSFPSQEYEF